jgi:hypothetical protein
MRRDLKSLMFLTRLHKECTVFHWILQRGLYLTTSSIIFHITAFVPNQGICLIAATCCDTHVARCIMKLQGYRFNSITGSNHSCFDGFKKQRSSVAGIPKAHKRTKETRRTIEQKSRLDNCRTWFSISLIYVEPVIPVLLCQNRNGACDGILVWSIGCDTDFDEV